MPDEPVPQKCLQCGGEEIASGLAFGYAGSSEAFQPDGFNKWKFTISSTVKVQSYACKKCGYLWKAVDPKELADFIAANCK